MLASGEPVTGGLALGALGGGTFGFNLWRLRRWADRRERQMEHIVARVRTFIGPDDV